MGINSMMRDTIIENTMSVSHFVRPYIHFMNERTDNRPNSVLREGNLRSTNCVYTVQFAPKPGRNCNRPFVINADIFGDFRGRLRVSGYEELIEESKKSEVVKWFVENTNVNKKHFEIARENFLLQVPINFDIVKYSEKIGTIRFRNADMEALAQSVYKAKKEAKGQKCI